MAKVYLTRIPSKVKAVHETRPITMWSVFDKEHNLTFLYNSADNRYNNGVKSKMEKRAESSELINNRETLRKAEMLEHWNSGKGKMKNKKREIRGEIEKERCEKINAVARCECRAAHHFSTESQTKHFCREKVELKSNLFSK